MTGLQAVQMKQAARLKVNSLVAKMTERSEVNAPSSATLNPINLIVYLQPCELPMRAGAMSDTADRGSLLTCEDHGFGGLEARQRRHRLLRTVPRVPDPGAFRRFHAGDHVADLPRAQAACWQGLRNQQTNLYKAQMLKGI